MSDVIVLKKNIKGEETWRYEGKVLMSRLDAVLIEASFNRSDLPFHGITFREGDRFLEAYFTHQWFNIFEIHDCDDDHLKGWYCNVTFPSEIKEHEIGWRDLALDLLVYPDGKQLVLDEDEFAALAIDERTRQMARLALEKLKQIFQPVEEFDLVDVWRRLNGAQAV
jgi:predicted RNA-binding protein associated with RNAse of E/G family